MTEYGRESKAIKRNLINELFNRLAINFLTEKIPCEHKFHIVAPMYRPPSSDCDYAARLAHVMECIAKKHSKDAIWIGNKTNLPVIDWSSNSNRKNINETMIQAWENCGMDQIVDFPTPRQFLYQPTITDADMLTIARYK